MTPKTTDIQPVNPITPIDAKLMIEHGESPTVIILAIAIFSTFLLKGLTELIRVILKESK